MAEVEAYPSEGPIDKLKREFELENGLGGKAIFEIGEDGALRVPNFIPIGYVAPATGKPSHEEILAQMRQEISEKTPTLDLKVQRDMYELAKRNGFWEIPTDAEGIKRWQHVVKLMLIVSEAAEAMEELRVGNQSVDWDAFGKELSDIIIRAFDLAADADIDIVAVTLEKHGVNLNRPFKHGGKAF